MQASGNGIEIAEAGGEPRNTAFVGAQRFDALLDPRHHRLHVEIAGAGVLGAIANGEDLLLCKVNQLAGRTAFGSKCQVGNLATRRHQAAQHRTLTDDVGVGHHVGGAGRVVGQRAQIQQPANSIELAALAQVFAERDHVARPVGVHQIGNRAEDHLMILAVKIISADAVGNVVPATVVQHQAAQH